MNECMIVLFCNCNKILLVKLVSIVLCDNDGQVVSV